MKAFVHDKLKQDHTVESTPRCIFLSARCSYTRSLQEISWATKCQSSLNLSGVGARRRLADKLFRCSGGLHGSILESFLSESETEGAAGGGISWCTGEHYNRWSLYISRGSFHRRHRNVPPCRRRFSLTFLVELFHLREVCLFVLSSHWLQQMWNRLWSCCFLSHFIVHSHLLMTRSCLSALGTDVNETFKGHNNCFHWKSSFCAFHWWVYWDWLSWAWFSVGIFMGFTGVKFQLACDSSHPIWVCTCVGRSPQASLPLTAPSSIRLTQSLIANVWGVVAWTEEAKHKCKRGF